MVRRSAALAASATLALGLPARPQGGPATLLAGPPDAEVEIEADHVTYLYEAQVLRLDGHVVARRGEGVLRAGKGTLDRARGLLSLEGGVLGVQGRQVFLADSAMVDLDKHSADLGSAVLYLKERPADPQNPRSGKNALVLHGTRVRQLGAGRYEAEDVRLTPCDCVGEPDYELIADRAVIDQDRARLSWAWLRIHGPAIPLFPLALPLHQRQRGLLAPQFGFGGSTGFAFALPIYFPFGDSYDLTLTPGYFTGGANPSHSPALGLRTVRGPTLGIEARYAPAAGTTGSLSLDLFDDLDQRDSPAVPSPEPGEPGRAAGRGLGGVRGVARFTHRTEQGAGVIAAQGSIATDIRAVNDAEPATLESLIDFLRTDLGAWRARGPLTLGLDATLLQDVRIDDGGRPDRRLFGSERRTTPQRLPAVFGQLAPVPLGPLQFSAEASAVHFLRFAGPDSHERETGFAPTDLNASSVQDLQAGDLSRAPVTRFDVAPRLTFAGRATWPVDLRLQLGARADAWVLESGADPDRLRAYALAGASAGLPLERRYGDVLHRLEPKVEVRALTRTLRSGGAPIGDPADAGGTVYQANAGGAEQGLAPGLSGIAGGSTQGVPALRRAYDEIDGAAPSSGEVEATMGVSQSLWVRAGKGASSVASLDLLQDALLWADGEKARLGEGSAIAGVQIGWYRAYGGVRFDWTLRKVSAAWASAGTRDARGDEIHIGLQLLRGSSSERLRAGIDELFSAMRLDAVPGSFGGSWSIGASVPLPFNLKAAYDLSRTVTGDVSLPAGQPDWTHTASLLLESPCKCAALQVRAQLLMSGNQVLAGYPRFSFLLDLKTLGSFSTQ